MWSELFSTINANALWGSKTVGTAPQRITPSVPRPRTVYNPHVALCHDSQGDGGNNFLDIHQNFRYEEKGDQPTNSKGINMLENPLQSLMSVRSAVRFPDLEAGGVRFETGRRDFGGKRADGERINFKRP